jgi:molybdopterin-guanine dinucleotide biosynthesis protein A
MDELGEVIVVAGPEQALPPLPAGVVVIADTRPGSGPLAGLADGLRAALSSATSGGLLPPRQALVVSADVPLISPAVIRLLCGALTGGKPHSAGEPEQRGPLWAVPLVAGHPQVLLSAVDLTVLAEAEAYLATGRRDPRGLLHSLQARGPHLVRLLPEAELRGVDPQLESFLDVDTWDDFLAVGGQSHP